MSDNLVRYEFDPTNPTPLTDSQRAELEALAAMPDDAIDLSDMPEVTDFSGWTRGRFYKPVKQQLTLRLDADVVHWFKTHAHGGGYQTRMNQALRDYVEAQQVKRA
ncbi:BrnA antitoxin family protein [Sphingomonas sp.]|uniref:BrnA antitoxin family protein n=1 Tax=Sphingomonas sp. TaxID=28214 RepID=UPI0035BC63BB